MSDVRDVITVLREVQDSTVVVRESLRALLWQVEDALTACSRIDAAVAQLVARLDAESSSEPPDLIVRVRSVRARREVQ